MAIHKILLVDDSPADLLHLKNAVKGVNATIVTATSGQDAIDTAISEKPDLIFMDIIMEGLDGYSACRELKRNAATSQIPVVFVSTKNQRADRMWAERQGGLGYITKPFTAEQIVGEVQRFN